ncbi:MAG: DUF4167 domain-containing protein [Alphaproteobacteria bacterium]|nr:DUF4167 domain-containing protein [Alphaproteobacteria bacterium]
MKHAAAGRRSRNRSNGARRSGPNKMQVFDSNGPDVRIRGTAHQVHEKYMALAKDAAASGDRILAESYLQHAEHYQRVINSWQDAFTPREVSDSTGDDSGVDAPSPVALSEDDDLSLPASLIGKPQAAEEPRRVMENA